MAEHEDSPPARPVRSSSPGLASSSGAPAASSPDASAAVDRASSTAGNLSEIALFSVSSPRRLGESLRSAASSHFPQAVERIVRESSQRSLSRRTVADIDDRASTTSTEEHGTTVETTPSSSAFLRSETVVSAPVATDSFASESFASAQTNSSLVRAVSQDTATGPLPAARKKSFFASFLDSSPAPSSSSTANLASTMSMADVPRKCYRCKLVLLGDSGTGKTTFQRCVSQSVLRTLPDVPPSVSSSSSLYYYRSTTKREKLDMLLVDGGPRGFITASTLGHIFHQTNFFILVMSLAGVKQRTSKRFLSFGNEPSAIVHAQDKAMIRSYITSIMAASPPTMRTPRLAIVGTHKDFLTDQSREAVETVLREINRVVTDVTQGMARSPLYTGSFAVSCTDHSCVPENRGGPRSIAELWAFICDLSLKEAVQVRAVVGDAALRVEELCERAAFHIPDDTTYTMRPIPFTARNSELNHATERMVTFIRRAKTELNFVIVHVRALRQVAFSLGIFSNDHLDAVLQMLSRDGEVLWLRHQPHHIGGREESVLLWPHLAHRAVVALTTYHEAAGAWPSNHHLFPGIDAEECHKADPERRAADGIFPPSLVVALSKALPQARRPVVERAETFALLLILTDFVFQRRCRRRPLPSMIKSPSTAAIDGRSVTPPPVADDLDVLMGGRSPAARGPPSSSGPPTLANHSTAPTSSHPPVSSTRRTLVEYIAPCLIRHDLPYTTQSYFTDSILHAPRNGLLLGSFAAISLLRTIKILHCPPTAFQRLMCRWAPYIVPGSAVYRNAVYLQRSCGGEETPHRDDHDAIDSEEDDGHDAGSQGPYSVGSPLRATRHTRCLVLADLVSADDKGIAASTPLSGSLHVRFVVVSSEDLLIVAHFINSLLRASCQALDAFYPNVEWSVEGEPFNHHHPTTTHKEGEGGRPEVVDIPTVDDLDAMFDAKSAAL